MGNDTERTSVVISTKGRVTDLRRCLASLARQTLLPFEVVIVDAGDIPDPELFFQPFRKFLTIRYIRAQVGLTCARNTGARESKGELILFLDDDTELEPDYLEKIMEVFSRDTGHRVGGVSGKIISLREGYDIPLSGKIRLAGKKIIGNLFFLPVEKNGCFHPGGFPTYPPSVTRDIIPVQCLYGANMAFRHEVLDRYPFDETLEGYCFMEDDDIAYRISREYVNMYTPCARLRHFESPVSRDQDFFRKKMLIKNYHYLFRKNIPRSITRTVIFWWSVLGLVITDFLTGNPEGIKGLFAGIIAVFRGSSRNDRCI